MGPWRSDYCHNSGVVTCSSCFLRVLVLSSSLVWDLGGGRLLWGTQDWQGSRCIVAPRSYELHPLGSKRFSGFPLSGTEDGRCCELGSIAPAFRRHVGYLEGAVALVGFENQECCGLTGVRDSLCSLREHGSVQGIENSF